MKILVGNMSWLNHSTSIPNNSIPDLMLSDTLVSQKDSSEVLEMIQQLMANTETPIVLLPLEASKWIELQGLIKQLNQEEEQVQEMKVSSKKEGEWIIELRSFILERLDNSDLNIDSIRKHFNMSRSTLYRKLKTLTKLSVAEYIKHVRLETAMQYLQTNNYSISDISCKTGFSSPSHFARSFKKVYGKSPSSLR